MSDSPMSLTSLASEKGVSRRTVQRWCAAGKVPGAYRTKGGHWRVRRPPSPSPSSPPLLAPVTVLTVLTWIKDWLAYQIQIEMEELTATQEFNNALEFSTVAKEISDDDKLPRYLKD